MKGISPDKMFGVEKFFDYIKHKGKYYRFSMQDGKPILIPVLKKEVEKHHKLSKELAEKFREGLDANKVLTEVFMTKYDVKELEKLDKLTKSGKSYQTKTREGYCVDMKFGNHIIPIID